MKKKTAKKLLPPELKRSTTITVKVSPTQKSGIEKLADQCDLPVSSYMLSRAYNYHPKARLTHEEIELMKNLVGVRADVKNYSNALNALNDTERVAMFRRYKFMLEWLNAINNMTERISYFLDRVNVPNPLPQGTTNQS